MSTYVTSENAPADFRRARPFEDDQTLPAGAFELHEPLLRVLKAAMDRIIPADEFPSAWEAGAGDYLLGQLQGDLRHLAESFAQGLASLEQEALARQDKPFAELSSPQQDAILEQIEQGQVSLAWTTAPRHFFAMLLHLTQEGFYGDPGNRGNRDEIAWKMIGYEHRPLGRPPRETP